MVYIVLMCVLSFAYFKNGGRLTFSVSNISKPIHFTKNVKRAPLLKQTKRTPGVCYIDKRSLKNIDTKLGLGI